MGKPLSDLNVLEISRMCGVARSTVSYWISRKDLPAGKSGKKYMVDPADLILFLRAQGHEVPEFLKQNMPDGPSLPDKRCWEFWSETSYGEKCPGCIVFGRQIRECFVARLNRKRDCRTGCNKCQYYGEYYMPQVDFIHQFEKPSAILKDLYLWAANQPWAELCGIPEEYLIGTGVEEFVHPDSLKMILNYNRRRNLGDTTVPNHYQVNFTNENGEKIRVNLLISPLKRPSGTWLAVIEQSLHSSTQEEQ